MLDVNKSEWIIENWWWLESWFDRERLGQWSNPSVPCTWEGAPNCNFMQIFRKSYDWPVNIGGDLVPNKGTHDELMLLAHKQEIIEYAVFGNRKCSDVGDRPYRQMGGFLELFERLPTHEDKVGFWILHKSRYLQNRCVDPDMPGHIHTWEYLTECCVRPIEFEGEEKTIGKTCFTCAAEQCAKESIKGMPIDNVCWSIHPRYRAQKSASYVHDDRFLLRCPYVIQKPGAIFKVTRTPNLTTCPFCYREAYGVER